MDYDGMCTMKDVFCKTFLRRKGVIRSRSSQLEGDVTVENELGLDETNLIKVESGRRRRTHYHVT